MQLFKMAQLGGFLSFGLSPLLNPEKLIEKMGEKLLENKETIISNVDECDKLLKFMTDHGIMLTINKIKVIKFLENRIILLKGATEKIINKKVRLLDNFFNRLMRVVFPLMRNVLTPLTKNVFIPLGLTVAASATDAAIQKKAYGPSMTALVNPNEERKDIMKMAISHE